MAGRQPPSPQEDTTPSAVAAGAEGSFYKPKRRIRHAECGAGTCGAGTCESGAGTGPDRDRRSRAQTPTATSLVERGGRFGRGA
jgi:hypothetical protein